MSDSVLPELTSLQKLVDAVGEDLMTAMQALALKRLLSASSTCCKDVLDNNAFVAAINSASHQALFISLWRVFDGDSKNGGIVGLCRHAKAEPKEFSWLFSSSGQLRHPNGRKVVNDLADKWLDWRLTLPFTKQLERFRHNYIAHRGKKAALGQGPEIKMHWSDIFEALNGIDKMVNEFRVLIDSTTVYHVNIYETVIDEGSFTLAQTQAHLEGRIGNSIDGNRANELKNSIKSAHDDQSKKNSWWLNPMPDA
ncbi:HEPN, AbiU2-like [Fimbriimonadaceae bacterium]